MWGGYAHPEHEEDSSSGTFSLHQLANQKHGKKLGQTKNQIKPVRLSSVKKTLPQRNVSDRDSQHSVSNFNSKLAAIVEDQDGGEKDALSEREEDRNVSLNDLMGKLGLNTPAGREEKISPDSGSFTATNTSAKDLRETGTDFTDSLPGHLNIQHQPGPVRMKISRPGLGSGFLSQQPVRQRSTLSRLEEPTPTPAPERERDLSLSYKTPRGKENFPSDLKGRLHALTGSSSLHRQLPPSSQTRVKLSGLAGEELACLQTPTVPRRSTTAPSHMVTPQPPQPPQPAQPPLPPPAATLLATPVVTPVVRAPAQPPAPPPPHVGTPLPGAGAAVMPPPRSNKEQVLVVRGKRYRVMKRLGKGGSSIVYEALDEEKNIVVAIKRVDLSDVDEAQKAGFVDEINLLRGLQGEDRVIKLYDYENVVTEEEELLYVVMEKGDTDLALLIKKYTVNKEITPAMIKHYWSEMLHAVAVVHKKGVIHKDLKPANFMLVAGRLKLIDFGIASSIQSDKTSIITDNAQGTFNYMSPESIQDLSGPQGKRRLCVKINFKTDVWSLGCILYQLTYGKLPFADIKHPLMKLQAITNHDHQIPFPELTDVDPRLVVVIKSCLERDVRRRASVEDLLTHSFLKEEALPTPVPVVNQAVNSLKMLEALEGVLSPNTFKKTKEGFRLVSQLEK